MSAQEDRNWHQTLIAIRPIKIAVIIVAYISVFAFVLSIGFLMYKAVKGDHIKVFGVEVNANAVTKHDTLKIKEPQIIQDAEKDTRLTPDKATLATQYIAKPSLKKGRAEVDTPPKTKYNIAAPVTQSAIGDNSTVTNNNNQGKNVFNGGAGNAFGDVHVGDISTSPHANEASNEGLLKFMESLAKDKGVTTKNVTISTMQGSNSGNLKYEIADFLKTRGYSVEVKNGISFSDRDIRDVEINVGTGGFSILLGTFN